jgi:Flp pilus assembly protein TadD
LAAERLERADPLMTLADLLRAEERYQDAVSVYDEAIARIATIEQHHWTVFYARGMSLERSGQWPRAESDLLRALELQPDQPLVLNYLGYSWVDMGVRLAEARSMIERAVAQRPNDGYIVDSLGWVLYQLEDFEAALVHLERAVELRPNDPVITDHYGDALWRIGRHSEARFQWRRALSLDPDANLAESVEEKLERDKPDELRTTDKS